MTKKVIYWRCEHLLDLQVGQEDSHCSTLILAGTDGTLKMGSGDIVISRSQSSSSSMTIAGEVGGSTIVLLVVVLLGSNMR